MPLFWDTLPEKVSKLRQGGLKKEDPFRPFFEASAQVLPDPLKSMKKDLPEMLFQRFRGVFSHVF